MPPQMNTPQTPPQSRPVAPPGGYPLNTMMPTVQHEQGTNLLEILINIAFGFVAGLMYFLGFQEVISFGTKLANHAFSLTPQGQQMAAFGMAANYLPYVVLTPLAGVVVKQLSSVRSIRGFLYFLAALAFGFGIAFLTKGQFAIWMTA